ncbi:MAG: hypothetical protein HZA49_07360 [Planctomycetes bacterium]|nr:hypothetical protein [Planctomycetota bacterium]
MNSQSFNFLKRISRHLWRLVIIDNSFKAGSYLLVVSAVLLLAARVFGISFLSESYLLFLSPVIGLLIGAAIGLFNKPSMADVALVVDRKSGSDNFFSTAYECSIKSSPNPVEDALAKDITGPAGKAARDFAFRYNRRYFYLFLILSGMMLIIWFTPVTQRNPDVHRGVAASVFESDIITISQGLSGIKQNQANPQEITEIIRQVEALIQKIRDNRPDKTLVLETIDGFIRKLSDAPASPAESAKLQSLLSQLKSLVGGSVAVSPGAQQDGTGREDGFSVYQPQPRSATPQTGPAPEKYLDKKVEISVGIVVKSREEAINNPYLPGEYKEIVKKYFEQRD